QRWRFNCRMWSIGMIFHRRFTMIHKAVGLPMMATTQLKSATRATSHDQRCSITSRDGVDRVLTREPWRPAQEPLKWAETDLSPPNVSRDHKEHRHRGA